MGYSRTIRYGIRLCYVWSVWLMFIKSKYISFRRVSLGVEKES